MPDSMFGPFEGLAGNGGTYTDVLAKLTPPTPVQAPQPIPVLSQGVAQPQVPQDIDWTAWEAGGVTGVPGEFNGNPIQAIKAAPGALVQIAETPLSTGGKLYGVYESEMMKQRIYAQQAEDLLKSGTMDASKRDAILRNAGYSVDTPEYTPSNEEQWQSLQNLANYKKVASNREEAARSNRVAAEETHKHHIESTDTAFGVDKEDAFAKTVKWASGVASGIAEAGMVSTATGGTGLLPFMMLDSRAQAYRQAIDTYHLDPEAAAHVADARGLVTGLVLGVGSKTLDFAPGAIGKAFSNEVQTSLVKDIGVKVAKGAIMAAEQQGLDLTVDKILTGSNDWTRLPGTFQDKLKATATQYLNEAVTFGLGYEVGGNLLGMKMNARVRRMAENYKDAHFGEGPEGLAKVLRDTAEGATALTVSERRNLMQEAHVADQLAKMGFKYVDPASRDKNAGNVSVSKDANTPANIDTTPSIRDGASLLEGLNRTEQEALADISESIVVPDQLNKSHLTKPLMDLAGIGKDEKAELSLVLQKMQDPRWVNSPEGESALEAVKPSYDKAMAAFGKLAEKRKAEAAERAVADYMADLTDDEIKVLNDHIKTTKETAPIVEQAAPVSVMPLSESERGLLPVASKELKSRRAAIDEHLADSDAIKEAVTARMEEENKTTGLKYKESEYEKAKEKRDAMIQKGITPENALDLLSAREKEQIGLGIRADAIRVEETDRMRARMHDTEAMAVAEKHAPGSGAMLKALRDTQNDKVEVAPEPAVSAEPIQPRREISVNEATAFRIALAKRNTLIGKTLNGMSEAAQAAATKHHATSVKMVRALKVLLDANTKWDKVDVDSNTPKATAMKEKVAAAYRSAEALVAAMGLSREETMRVQAAYQDAIFAGRTKGLSTLDASRSILEQARIDMRNGVRPEAAAMNMRAAIASNPRVADIVTYAESIGLSPNIALEAITQAAGYAKGDRVAPTKTGNKLSDIINEGITAHKEGGGKYLERELSESKAFPAVVKELLRGLVGESETEEISSPRPQAFDTTTADGKVRTIGYIAARAFIRAQRSKWMSYIGAKGSDMIDVRKAWSRDVALPWIKNLIEAEKRGATAPKNDSGRASKRSWILSNADFVEITKALIEDGFLREEHGRYVITKMADSAETVLGINPELVEKAWKLVPHNEDPRLAKIPTVQEEISALYANLTPEQMTVLQMYHGIGPFAGSYITERQIAKALPGKSEGWVKEQLDYANKLIASRFPNFALLADKYAGEISRYMTPGELYADAYTENFRRDKLDDIRDAMSFIARMPGALNAYTKRGTDLNQLSLVGEGTLINQGFFPALKQKLIDAGAPDALLRERAILEKQFHDAREEYTPLASKPEHWRTDADRNELARLEPAFRAAREGYLSVIGKINSTVSPETRAMLNFVKEAFNSKRLGMGEDAAKGRKKGLLSMENRREVGAISAADRSIVASRRKAFSLANAIGEQVATVLESYGFPRELTMDNLRETVISDAQRAYRENPNSPNKSAFTAALMAIENNDHARLISTDIVSNEVVDALRSGLGMSDRTTEYRQALEVKQLAINHFETELASAYEAHAKTLKPVSDAQRRLDGQRASIAIYRANLIESSAEIAKNLFAMRITDPGAPGLAPSVRLIKDSISMIEDLPLTLGHTIEGLPELVANMKSLSSSDSATQLESARAISNMAGQVINRLNDVASVLSETAGNKKFSEEERQMALAFGKQLKSIPAFVNAMGKDVVTLLTRFGGDKKAVEASVGAVLPATKTNEALASLIDSFNEDRMLMAKHEQRQITAQKELNEANRVKRDASKKIDSLVFQRNEMQKSIETLLKSPLPANEAELKEMLGNLGVRDERADFSGDERLGAEDLGDLTDFNPDVAAAAGHEMGKGSVLAQEMQASGIRLKPERLLEIANGIIKAVKIPEAQREGRATSDLIADQIDKLNQEMDRKGISIEDSAKIAIGMGGVAELAAHPEYIKLLTDRTRGQEELVSAMADALGKLNPKREAEVNLMMATHAAENLTGKRIESREVDTEAIKAIAESKESALAAEIAKEKSKQDLREGSIVSPESVSLAIADAKKGDAASKERAIALAERLWREQPGTPESYELRQKARDLMPKAKSSAIVMELASALMVANYSPEGAALMLGAGTAYVAYKLGMKRSAKFAEVMNRIKAYPKNTVSEIAAKIKGVAKGISDFTARIMAAVFKDTNGKDIGPGKKQEATPDKISDHYNPAEPIRDDHGYMTPNGKARIAEASEAYSDPRTLLRRYNHTPGSMGNRVFSFDVVRSEIIHPNGGVFAWDEMTPGVGKAFAAVMEARLKLASRNGENMALVLGGNGAGKTTFMGSSEARETYNVLQEVGGSSPSQLISAMAQANRLGVPTDMVYVLRNLGDMIEGTIQRGVQEQRLGYAGGFADVLVDGMKGVIDMAKNEDFKGDLIVVDDSSGNQYAGKEAIARLESLASTLDKGYIANRYRETAAQFLLENGHEIPAATRDWLEADSRGELRSFLSRVSEEGYLPPKARSTGVQDISGRNLESHAQDPQVLDRGSLGLVVSEPLTPLEVAKPYIDNRMDLIRAGATDEAGLEYLNAGFNLDQFVTWADSLLGKSKINAKLRENRAIREEQAPGKLNRGVTDGIKKVSQWVHRMRTDDQTRVMDLMLLKLHDKDSVTGGFQPTLVKFGELKDGDPEQYRMMGKAITDSSVQERVMKDAELMSRYKLSPDSIDLYKEAVGALKGVQKITLAAFNKKLEEDIADVRDDQDALDPGSEKYEKQYRSLEDRISDLEDHGEKVRAIIQKNPVFLSLLRNDKGTRRLDLVDAEGNHIGMTHVDTGDTATRLSDEQRQLAVDSMLEQHSKRLWNEGGRVGTPEKIYERLKKEYADGKIQDGFYLEGKFIEGQSKPLEPDDHFNFIRQAGGMLSAETLQKLIENRGEGVSSDVAQNMMRDLMYLGGAREVEGRLNYARRNVAGYSEDVIGALSMHAHNAGYMISNLKYATQIRSELSAFRRKAIMENVDLGERAYREMLNYVVSMNAPTEKAGAAVKAMDALKFYSAWRALAGKPSFGVTQAFQGSTTTQLHLMAHYDTAYFNKLYSSSWKAANKFLGEMLGLGKDLSMVDPIKLSDMMDKTFTYENFKDIWKSPEEAERMAPVVKEVMHKVIQGSTFKDVNVGMQLGVDDAAANAIDRAPGTTKLQKATDTTKNVVGYISNKTENMNRLRDIIAYTVACATESRATDAGKKTGQWAEYGYVSITNDSYDRLTYSDLHNEVAKELKDRYRGQSIGKKEMEDLVNDETTNRIMTFAERNSAHSNFNTGRGYGSELVWNPKGNNVTSAFMKTAALFRLFPVNIINAWRTDVGITARRLEAEGRKASDVMVQKYKSTAYGAIASMLLGGAFAVPTAGMLTDLLSGVWNLLGHLWGKPPITDIKKDFVDWTRKKYGNYPARFVAAGIFGLTPFYGLGAQLSAGEGPLSWDTRHSFVENVGEQVLGANVGAVEGVLRGMKRIDRGDYVGGAANIIAPVGVSNVIDAYVTDNYAPGRKLTAGTEDFYRYSKNGVQGRLDQFSKAMGATPQKSSMLYEEDAANYRLKEARKAIIQNLQDAYEKGNITDRNWTEVQKWNDLMIEMERVDMVVKPRPGAMKGRMKRELQGEMRINEKLGTDEEE